MSLLKGKNKSMRAERKNEATKKKTEPEREKKSVKKEKRPEREKSRGEKAKLKKEASLSFFLRLLWAS